VIKPIVIAEAKRLLAAGLSQRAIARRLGISRGTVGAIATGRRPDYESLKGDNEPEKVRCTGCGGMVAMPCRACRVRAAAAIKGRRFQGSRLKEGPAELALDLRPAYQARYEEVHRARQAAGEEPNPQSPIPLKQSPADRVGVTL